MSRSIRVALGAPFLLAAFGSNVNPVDAAPQIPYPTSPDWTSSDTRVATGCGFGDINGDGWDDLVVANGNDISRQRVAVYYNQGNGTYPANPDWSSSDIDFHGHLSIGDVNGDGWLDVAVSVFLGPAGFSQKGRAKLYLNNGSGTLSSTPSWSSSDSFYSFSCALGDADGDGDLDLAVAVGEAYYNSPDRNRIYYNTGGTLAGTPGWVSDEVEHTFDIGWGDMDGDGDLDLVSCNAGDPMRIHYSVGGAVQTAAGWTATSPSSPNGNTLSIGDINGDGFLDVAFSDNSQLGGSGRLYAYHSDGVGGMGTTPSWQSGNVGYASAIVLVDVQGDGLLDAVTGKWWGPVRMYLNTGGALSGSAAYTSSTGSVVEAIPVSDVDRDGVVPVLGENHAGDGSRKVFYTEYAPVLSVEAVVVDGSPLSSSEYCYDAEGGWFSLATPPVTDLVFDYTTSTAIDFAVSNWDSSIGNYVFKRQEALATPYCFGDGSGTACPCGNETTPGDGQGCENSTGTGARIVAGGSRSVSAGDLFIVATGLRKNRAGLLFSGLDWVSGGAGIPFGAGLRCAGGTIKRLSVEIPDADGTAVWGPGIPAGAHWGAGDTRYLQVWYRDPNGPCGEQSNQSNGLKIVFLP